MKTLLSRRGFVSAGALAVALVLIVLSLRNALAWSLSESSDPRLLRYATSLEPRNPELWHRLGRYQLLVGQNPEESLAALRQASLLNPNDARIHLDIALAQQMLGRLHEQQNAIDAALRADPASPSVAWEAANFYLATGSVERGLEQIRTVAKHDPDHARAAYQIAWRAIQNIDPILQQGVPQGPNGLVALLLTMLEQREYSAADLVWERLTAFDHGWPLDAGYAYVDHALARKDATRARHAWEFLVNSQPGLNAYRFVDGNLIVNGGFDAPLLNRALDWRYTERPGVELRFDNAQFRSGTRSLRLTFSGAELQTLGLQEFIVVPAGQRLRFTAQTRIENLRGGRPRFTFRDVATGTPLAEVPFSGGSQIWQPIGADLLPSAGSLLQVELARGAGAPLSGEVWIDDLRLEAHP